MNSQVGIKRSRGVVCGVALRLLGLWGGLAPFVGPYFHFGYTPDKAWAYTSGRLYFSAVPGGAALLGGLMVAVTRNRVVGVIGGALAVLGGLWFVLGSGITFYLLKYTSISSGVPLGPGAGSGGAYTARMYLEVLALFGALGAVIIFFGALACGRLTLLTAADVAAAEADGYYPEYSASSGASSAPDPGDYRPTTGPFPAATDYQGPTTGQLPTVAGQFPSPSGQFNRPSSFRRAPDDYSPPTPLSDPPTA